jgi:hypothetical protein
MRVVRVCRAKYPDLDGKGAALSGGRWNSKGTHIVYTSSGGALSVLEYRVHTRVDPGDLIIFTIEIPDRVWRSRKRHGCLILTRLVVSAISGRAAIDLRYWLSLPSSFRIK